MPGSRSEALGTMDLLRKYWLQRRIRKSEPAGAAMTGGEACGIFALFLLAGDMWDKGYSSIAVGSALFGVAAIISHVGFWRFVLWAVLMIILAAVIVFGWPFVQLYIAFQG